MSVVDASAVVGALILGDARGRRVRARLQSRSLMAPELLDIEVLSSIRGRWRGGALDLAGARAAVADLARLPIQRFSHALLLVRVWELRHNLSAYDASYAALAELMGQPLLTIDRRMARAPGLRCPVELID